MKFTTALIVVGSLAVATGCTDVAPLEDGENVGDVSSAVLIENGFFSNGLFSNGLFSNGLFSNGLFTNGLFTNGYSAEDLATFQAPDANGDAARLFIRYAIVCAFLPSQAFDISWTDTDGVEHTEHYVGELGVAPHWATEELGLAGQHSVTACMAAHVNYYGLHVSVSARSGKVPLRLHPNDQELIDFSKLEGAFWGNLWAPQPYINACYNSANVNNSRAASRDCATGHLNADGTTEECGIINIVGSCASVCKKYNSSRGYYSDCRERPGVSNKRTDRVITTALP